MKRTIGLVVFVMFLCAPVFAEEPEKGQKPVDQKAKVELAEHKADTSSPPTQTPLPPGIEKRGKLPPGLEKSGKTPRGWSQGKAWWKHPGQTTPGHTPPGHTPPGASAGSHGHHANHSHGHH